MHKNKKFVKKVKVTKWDIAKLVASVVGGLIIAKFAGDWFNAQSFARAIVRPGELSSGSGNGIVLLTIYCACLVLMIVGGYLLGRRIRE
jgi:hypothetical protein